MLANGMTPNGAPTERALLERVGLPARVARGRAIISTALMTAAALLALATAGLAAQSQRGAVEDGLVSEMRARERALADAMHGRDERLLDQLLAPDYRLRGAPDVDRATWIRNALELCWGDRSDIEAFRARQDSDVVTTTFELTFYVDPVDCRPAVLRSLVTDIWTRHPDGWRLQIRHSAPPPGAGIAAQYGVAPEPSTAWDASSEVSLVATGGNTSTQTLGLAGALGHRTDTASTRAAVAFLTSEAAGVTNARSLAMQARHGIRVSERLELFGRGAYARDRFAGIDSRATADAGASYTTSLPPRHALTAEGSMGFTIEQRLDTTDLAFATATGALEYAWTIVPGSEFTQGVSLSADLESAGNWRGTGTTAVSVSLTRVLSFKASHAIEFRHRPVTGFGSLDMRTAAALVFSFGRRPR